VLVVGVNDDASVAALKGPGRPLVPAVDRAELLASLECVDFVVIFKELTPEAFLADLRPDVHCKGGDYGPSGERLPERTIVEASGGRIEVTPYFTGHSTTKLIDRARDRGAKLFDEASQP
jgi:rfaE bifunctional protein nucleotidyltransferase chain/domain